MIKWNLPDLNEPGYLRRRRDMIKLLDNEATPKGFTELVKFLAQYVEGEEPVEQLLDVSQADYSGIILYFLGYINTVSDPKEESSELQ